MNKYINKYCFMQISLETETVTDKNRLTPSDFCTHIIYWKAMYWQDREEKAALKKTAKKPLPKFGEGIQAILKHFILKFG